MREGRRDGKRREKEDKEKRERRGIRLIEGKRRGRAGGKESGLQRFLLTLK